MIFKSILCWNLLVGLGLQVSQSFAGVIQTPPESLLHSAYISDGRDMSLLMNELRGESLEALRDTNSSIGIQSSDISSDVSSEPVLQAIIESGQRNLEWFERINRYRAEKLELSNESTVVGTPIDQPKKNSVSIISADRRDLLVKLPASFLDRIERGAELTDEVPGDLTDEEYLAATRKWDRLYQNASRWILQRLYLDYYRSAVRSDIRGYYYLSKLENLDQKLEHWASLPVEERTQMRVWLEGLCLNSDADRANCERQFLRAERGSVLRSFKNRYWSASKALYESFFQLRFVRQDLTLHSSEGRLRLQAPFIRPDLQVHQHWFQENVEEEWKLGSFQLKLDWVTEGPHGRLQFLAGATPNVSERNIITMDSNRSINEYLTRWTIRHEYGHVLGFPDCYVEYFDAREQVMVNYQIDVNNLMCSRKGKLLPIHVETLLNALH